MISAWGAFILLPAWFKLSTVYSFVQHFDFCHWVFFKTPIVHSLPLIVTESSRDNKIKGWNFDKSSAAQCICFVFILPSYFIKPIFKNKCQCDTFLCLGWSHKPILTVLFKSYGHKSYCPCKWLCGCVAPPFPYRGFAKLEECCVRIYASMR